MISVILNSRGRVHQLTSLLSSIASNTENIDNIEVLINVDSDDSNTLSSIDFLSDMYSFTNFFVNDRPKNLHKNLNKLLSRIRGHIVIVVNDDVQFLTDKWDINVVESYRKAARKYDDGYFYLVSKDNSADKEGDKKYPSFPILTKEVIETLEYIMPEQFVGLGADVYLYRIFVALDRTVDVDVSFNHVFHSSIEAVFNADPVASDMRANSQLNYVNPWSTDISSDLHKLTIAIAKRKMQNKVLRSISE